MYLMHGVDWLSDSDLHGNHGTNRMHFYGATLYRYNMEKYNKMQREKKRHMTRKNKDSHLQSPFVFLYQTVIIIDLGFIF